MLQEPWIKQAASKAKAIMNAANEVHPQAVMRMVGFPAEYLPARLL